MVMATTPTTPNTPDNKTDVTAATVVFPYKGEQARLQRYTLNRSLFRGEHFDAFKIKVDSDQYNKAYAQLKYVVSNFAGLISKVAADMLFSEPPKISTEGDSSSEDDSNPNPKTDPNQKFIDAVIFDNQFETQLYESSLSNSYNGDGLFQVRIGQRTEGYGDPTVIIETVDPSVYFPHLDPNNVRARPVEQELAWLVPIEGKMYLRKVIHKPGQILNELHLMDGDKIGGLADLGLLGIADLLPVEETGIDRSLLVHIPNWKDGTGYFGYDDYADLMSLFFALNNRLTKTENVLDKHTDPILALPEGVLDEDGQVRREKFNMFEIPADGAANPTMPEYITWNANLDSAFKEIDKLLDLLYMMSETSPAAFGIDKGGAKSESGRALKYRLMRTIHKVRRKRNYYDNAIKELLYVAQAIAKAHGVKVMGVPAPSTPVLVEIEWNDGIPIDSFEQAQEEELRLASGNTSVKDSIARLDQVDDDEAQKKLEAILKETAEISKATAITVPVAAPGGPIASQGAEAAGATKGKDIKVPTTGRPPASTGS